MPVGLLLLLACLWVCSYYWHACGSAPITGMPVGLLLFLSYLSGCTRGRLAPRPPPPPPPPPLLTPPEEFEDSLALASLPASPKEDALALASLPASPKEDALAPLGSSSLAVEGVWETGARAGEYELVGHDEVDPDGDDEVDPDGEYAVA